MRKLKLLLAACALFGFSAVSAQDAGTYYIQNVSNGKWMGPGNNWGTQASTLSHADYWKLAVINEGVYTLESVVSNGGTNYYFTGEYCDGGATNFTFTSVAGKEHVYTIANTTGGLMTANGNIINMSGTDADETTSQWKLWSESDMAAGMAAATVENPFDATYLIKDHDLGRNNRDYSAWSNTGATAPKSSTDAKGATRFSIEAYKCVFNVNQTLSGIPNGVYAVRVNGFYRQDGSDANLPYVYANDSKTTLPVRTGTENNMQDAAVAFEAGNYLSDAAYVQVTDGTLTIGVATEGTSCWSIFKNFHLAYYGDYTVAEVLLSDYVKAYNAALTEAKAFTEASMFATAWNTLQTAISDNTLNLNSVTQEQLETATANLKAANAAANAAVKAKPVYDSAVALINGGTNVDLTSIVTNASFEEGNLNGWTTVNGGATANNNNWAKVGTWYVERWTENKNNIQAQLSDGTLTHDALVLPAGLYTVTAKAQNQEQQNGVPGTGYFLYANDEKVEITGTNTYSTSVLLTDKAELVIKFALENCTGNWISCDDIHLTYVGEDFPAYTLVTGNMNAEVAAAQTAADEAFKANNTVANYNALTAAITAAQASKDAYAAAATAIANANALKEAHNLASATAKATFAEAIAALETKYNENTMTTDEGNGAGTTLGTVVTDWRAAANSAAVAYLNDGFSLNAFDADLYINTWSEEGEKDDSNFKVPFYEYWTDNANSLGEHTWTGTLTDLPNGQYKVSAWIRVRAKDGVTATEATGIALDVNGGEDVDATEGTQIGESQFTIETFEAIGLVKDGTLNFNVKIAADNNISWLSFKNVKYTKLRDLTVEEMATAPTAIALYIGEEEVIEPIALDASNKTVTLTPKYTPVDATEGYISWESSDQNVAKVEDGVVTAVSPGTATITVASTLAPAVTATATINVTAAESTVPTFVNNGATRTSYNFGPNLIKNGSFEYPDNYYGWTIGNGEKMTNSQFTIETNGAADGDKYIQSVLHTGSNNAGSLRTAWPIEAGKKYVFGFKIKNTSGQSVTNNEWIRVSLCNANPTAGDGTIINPYPSYNGEWTDYQIVVDNTENTFTFVQAHFRWLGEKGEHTSFDNFYLCEILAEPTTVGNVEYATAAIPTANIGTGAFQYSQDAIDAVNALVQGEATVEDVQNAYDAVTTLNAPATDKLYNIINISEGYNHKGKAVTFKSASDADLSANKTFMGYTEVPGSIYPQGVKFTTTGELNTYKLSYTRADGNTVYVGTGSSTGLGSNNDQIRPTTDAEKAVAIKVVATATEGVWKLYNTLANKNIGANGADDQGFYTTNQFNSMKIQEAVANEVALNIDEKNQYGTLIVPFDAAIPTGVVAYSCGNVDGTTLELSTETSFKANTPYIVFAEAGITETLSGIGAAYTDANYTAGLLTGIYAAKEVPVGSYILQNQNDVVAFYNVVDGKQPMLGANHAYLTVGNSAREALYFGGDATGIMAIDALTSGNATIFNAAGAQIPALQKGMNIVRKADGKSYKVIVK